MSRELLISYASAFASFLLRSGIDLNKIRAIYVFGSVARGDFDRESDVDVFIDIEKNYEKIADGIVKKALRNFLASDEVKKFKLLGIKNEISARHGAIEEWELKESIKKEGIVLFSQSAAQAYKKYFLVKIFPIKDAAKRNKIIRKFEGRKEKQRKEKGLINELGGFIIGTRIYAVPSEKINDILKLFSKEKINYEMKEIWM